MTPSLSWEVQPENAGVDWRKIYFTKVEGKMEEADLIISTPRLPKGSFPMQLLLGSRTLMCSEVRHWKKLEV